MADNYFVDIDGLGAFEVMRRTMLANNKIRSEFNRITEGQESLSEAFEQFCVVFSTLKALVVKAPTGWNLDNLDPDDDNSYQQMYSLYFKIVEKEKFFRGKDQGGQNTSAGSGSDDRVVVS